jgi:hypothetical protein
VIACVLNQLSGHWLLFDALNCFIILSLRMKQEYNQLLMDDDGKVILELFLLASNTRKEVRIFDS